VYTFWLPHCIARFLEVGTVVWFSRGHCMLGPK
jgi:hypothetical protein